MANHYNLTFVEDTGTFNTDADPVSNKPRTLPVYYAPSVDAKGKWSGKNPLPKIGDKVTINFNQLGSGIVENYFIENEYLGVRVRLDNQPEWHRKQNPGRNYALVFGLEIDPVDFGKQQRYDQPLYPHVPKSRQPLFPHVPKGQQPGTKLPATGKLSRNDVEVYLSLPPYKASIWVENKKTGKTIWKLEGAENINRFGWKDQNRDQLEESVLKHLEDIGVLSGGMTGSSLELLASTEGNPIRKFCCRQCGDCAPKELLEEGRFLDRISWLRSHYQAKHPGMWGKMSPMTVEDGEPVPQQYRHLVGLVSEPLPKEAD